MATRNRIHRSSVRRHGPTHTHDYPAKGRKRKDEEEETISPENVPEYGAERGIDWDEEGASLSGDGEDGEMMDQEHMPAGVLRKRRDMDRPSQEMPQDEAFDFAPEEERNNYDDAGRTYPPSWRH